MLNPTTGMSQYYPWARNLLFLEEKEGLREYARGRMNIVEIGVFEGASACALKKGMHKFGKLWLIDPFIPDSMNDKIRARKWITRLNIKCTFPFFRTIFWINKKSEYVDFTKDSIDFLFIDGDHSIEGAKKDFDHFSPSVQINGLIALHDSIDFSHVCAPAKGHEGPKKLRKEMRNNSNYKYITSFGTISIFRKIK